MDIKELKLDPANARRRTERGEAMIQQSLQEVGAARSIVIDEHNVILAGNGTIEAAGQVGINKVHVVDVDGETIVAVRRSNLTPEQKKRLAILDNRTGELAEWDAEELLRQADFAADLFSDQEWADLMPNMEPEPLSVAEPSIDRAEELQAQWGTERGQVWQLGRHRLMCGDSTDEKDVGVLLGAHKPNIMVTDPPYGVNYDANWRNEAAEQGLLSYSARRVRQVKNDDRIDWVDAYHLFPGNVLYAWSPGGYQIIITGQSVQNSGFEIRAMIIWTKPHYVISRAHYSYQHEPCWFAVRKGAQADWIGGKSETTKWEIPLDKNVEGSHSTQKPLECMARPIRHHRGDVYDPFVGSGTTIMAAEQLGRTCYAMEIDPAYVAVCLQRWVDSGLEEPKCLKQADIPN